MKEVDEAAKYTDDPSDVVAKVAAFACRQERENAKFVYARFLYHSKTNPRLSVDDALDRAEGLFKIYDADDAEYATYHASMARRIRALRAEATGR